MRTILLDTVGLLALGEERDQWHTLAREAMDAMQREGALLVTTTAILLECGNAAARKPYRADVEELRAEFKTSGRLLLPTALEDDEAWRQYRAGEAGQAGIVDQLSFVVIRGLKITDAFTNDRHFKAAGFNTLF